MEKLQLRLTADEAERMASALNAAALTAENADEVRELVEQAARLNYMAARARARAARAGAQ